MKQVILEKVYGNIGDGFRDHYISKELKSSDLNKKITLFTSYKGNKRRFIYKRINNFSIFLHSIPFEKDDKGRGGNFLSHFIILKNVKELNPTIYIDSESFITEKNLLTQKREEISSFQKVSYDMENNFSMQENNIINIIKDIIYYITSQKKIIFYLEDIDQADKLLFKIFSRLPRTITINLSFSINAEKLNEQTICDINILDLNKHNIDDKIKSSIIDITKYESKSTSTYTDFLLQNNFEEIKKFLFFLEQKNFSLKNLESTSKAYLIDIGKYPIKTENDILDNIIGIFDETKLNNFLLTYLNKDIKISINTLKRIDNIIKEKYKELTSITYYKFIIKYSQKDYKYFLEKYRVQKNIFIYLLCSYNLGEEKFLKELEHYNDSNILNFLIENDFYQEIFYIQKKKLLDIKKSWSYRKNEIEKEVFIEYFFLLSNSKVSNDSLNIFFQKLLENSSKKFELLIFIHKEFKQVLNEITLKQLYLLINDTILSIKIEDLTTTNFLRENDFINFKGLNNIKLVQIKYYLNKSYITEDNLNKIIKIIK